MRRKVSNLSPLQYLARIFSASFLQNMVENQERKKRMSIRLTAVFPGEDAADLAVLSLRGKGCEVISQETQQRLRPGVSNEVASSRFWDFSPIPMQDGGTLFSMRLPGMPRVTPVNMQSTSPGGVILTIRVPDASADFAERHLYNQGASHVRRLQ